MENNSERREEAQKERGGEKEDPRERFRRLTSSLPGGKLAQSKDEALKEEDAPEDSGQPTAEPGESVPQADFPSDTPVIVFDYPGEEDSSIPPVYDEDGYLESVPTYKLNDADIVIAGEEIADQEISEPDSSHAQSNDNDTIPPEDLKSRRRVPPPPLGDTPTTYPLPMDSDRMPLPRRVTETDMGATDVSRTTYDRSQDTPRPGG